MIESIRSDLKVVIPPFSQMLPFEADVPLVNANPQCGPFPFVGIVSNRTFTGDMAGLVMQADLSSDFIRAQVLPRGRPHFSLIHVALVDDAVAVTSLTGATRERYGQRYRYIEMGVAVGFHREAFVRGTMNSRQFRTVSVDGFRVRWRALPLGDGVSLLTRGIFQVSIFGLDREEEVPVASVEGTYMRRRAVTNQFAD